jgi:hypothetical protein
MVTLITFQAGINLGLRVAQRGNLLFYDLRSTVQHTTKLKQCETVYACGLNRFSSHRWAVVLEVDAI